MNRTVCPFVIRHTMAWVACLSLFGLPAVLSASDYRTQHVVILVMDGARYTETWGDSTHTYIPKIAANLAPKGTVLSAFRTNIVTAVGGNTETCPGHATLITGTYQKIANDGSQLPTQPTIFQYFRKQSGAADTAAWVVTAKDKLWICSNSSASGWNGLYRPRFNCGVNGDGTGGYRSDSATHSVVLSTLTTYRPSLMLINYKDPDSMGHAANWTGYLNAIKATDGFADEVWATIQADPQLKDTTTLFVTNDHGRHTSDYTSHGDNCEGCTHLLAVAIGPDFRQGVVSNTARQQTDIAATAAHLLNINMSPSLQGTLMSELLKTPVISSASTATATIGASFTYQIVASSRPTAYSATGLPAGLSLNTTTGSITGIPSGPAGISNVQLSATNAGGIGAPMTLTVSVTNNDGSGTADVQVAASSDDAEETISTGAVNLTSTDLELLVDASPQVVGMRFPNVTVPHGATVTTAYIQFKTDEAVNANPTSLTIAGEATDHAATFTTASKNISSRARTAAAVIWSPPDWTVVGEAGTNQRTPELKAIVQEIVNRSGWANGNSLAIIVTGVSTSKRVAESYDKGTGGAPVLHIAYSIPLANQAPQIQSQPWADPNPVVLPNATTLSVIATDDGLPVPPGQLTYTWSKETGPGAVNFGTNNGSATAHDCTAQFAAAGEYLLRVTVSDGQLTDTGTVSVTASQGTGSGSGTILREVWTNVSGTSIAQIPLTATPAIVDELTSFEAPSNWADNYGTRVRGYVHPPASGNYTFWIASDDSSQLWLSSDEDPGKKTLIASVDGWTGSREWTKYASQRSAVVTLTAGRKYYIEALQKEGAGGDNLAVAWQGPGLAQAVIAGQYLSPFDLWLPGSGTILREVWTNVSGTSIAQIPLTTSPAIMDELNSFEAPTNWADNYGTRVRGYLHPPVSGAYTFWIASDDSSQLWLSSDEDPNGKVLIASVNGWTSSRQWTKYTSQQSAVVNLVAGRKYYIEALQKEGGGGDNLAVSWQFPGQSQTVIDGPYLSPFDPWLPGSGTIRREVWTNAGGTAIADIPLTAAPSIADELTSFEAPTNWADNYGTRVRGYLHPPVSGDYTFWIASDDSSQLWLSSDEDPGKKTLIASVNGWTNSRQWTKYTSQQSTTINLTVGRKYYIEALQKEGGGGDNLAVSWQFPGQAQAVISSQYLSPYLPPAGLPAPWQDQDVGAVGFAGSTTYAGGLFTIDGGGADIWNSADEFHFVYRTLSGDGQITARVNQVENTNAWAKAGVMVRESLATGSRHAIMVVTPGNGASFQYRANPDSSSASVTVGSISAPLWVRLVRSGTTLSGYRSTDGVSWTLTSSTDIMLPTNVYIGLVATSHDDSTTCTATMDQVTVTVP